MSTEEYSIGYDDGRRDGYNEAMNEKPARDWVGLTDEDVTWLCNNAKSHNQTWGMFVRAIEAKLREKNA